jgi:hypothetical protein
VTTSHFQHLASQTSQRLDVSRTCSAVQFFLEGFLIDSAVADTGAEATGVPESVVNTLESRGLDTQRIRLEKPIVFHSAKADGVDIVYSTKITRAARSRDRRESSDWCGRKNKVGPQEPGSRYEILFGRRRQAGVVIYVSSIRSVSQAPFLCCSLQCRPCCI